MLLNKLVIFKKYMERSTQDKKIISNNEFKKLSAEWTALDNEYDNLFQDFLDNPHVKTQDELSKFKAMQERLYAIELELYKVAEDSMTIKNYR